MAWPAVMIRLSFAQLNYSEPGGTEVDRRFVRNQSVKVADRIFRPDIGR
jgi:hypothetical protein